MTLVLDATVGGASSNAYCTIAQADAYFEARAFGSAWTLAAAGATLAAEEQAIVMATSLLERERWLGTKGATPAGGLTQRLAWPRRWAPTLEYDAAPDVITEYFVDTSLLYHSALSIPRPVIEATCELALEILRAGTTDPFARSGFGDQNVKAKQIDVLSWTFFEPQHQARGLDRFPTVLTLIRALLRAPAARVIERI